MNSIHPSQAVFLACSLLCAACDGDPEPDGDAVDAAIIHGKADGGLSPQELEAVLWVANNEDAETLDRSVASGGVGLDQRAVQGIIDVRAGEDGVLGTDDDVAFETLQQLDDVPYVGPVALQRLVDFAHANDLVAPDSGSAEALVGTWTIDDGMSGDMAFQNYPRPGYEHNSGGVVDRHGRIGVEVVLGDDGTPLASGRCQVNRRPDFGGGVDWDVTFSALPLTEIEPGVWSASFEQAFPLGNCNPWEGEKRCVIELGEDGFASGRIVYELEARFNGSCGAQDRTMEITGTGHKQ